MGKATETQLDALHGLIAEAITEELKTARKEAQPGDKRVPLSPKTLAVAIKFLKDNGIDAPATSPRFNSVIEELKKLDVDGDALLAN